MRVKIFLENQAILIYYLEIMVYKIIKWKKIDSDELLSVRFCQKEEEIFLTTQKGTIVRQKINAIALQKRSAKGVKVQNLIHGDVVFKVSLISENFSEM